MTLQQTKKEICLEEPPQGARQWSEQAHVALVGPLAHGLSSLVLASGGMKSFEVRCVEQEKVLACQRGFVFTGGDRRR